MANIFLNGAVKVIRLWVNQNSTPAENSMNFIESGFASSSCRLYWISNVLQLLIYLKRDGTYDV